MLGRERQKGGVSRGKTFGHQRWQSGPQRTLLLGNVTIDDEDWKFKIAPSHLLDSITPFTLKHT